MQRKAFFRTMNGTEKIGVLKNEKVKMEIFLFPFPGFSFY